MHLPVWIITGVTDPMELGRAFQEAEQLAEPFRESNINPGTDPDNETLAPVSWDWKRTGGRYDAEISMGDALNHATGEEAAAVPGEAMPRVVIAPNGYPAVRDARDDPEDLRRVLLHWPQNIVVAQDWHY